MLNVLNEILRKIYILPTMTLIFHILFYSKENETATSNWLNGLHEKVQGKSLVKVNWYQFYSWFLKNSNECCKNSKWEKHSERNQFIHPFFDVLSNKNVFFFFFFTCRLQSIALFDQNVTNWMKNVFRLMSVNELKTRSTKSGHQKKIERDVFLS